MTRAFNKQPVHWLNQVSTVDFIRSYAKPRNHCLTELVIVTRIESDSGTWMHEDVAIEFARWLLQMD